MSEPAPSSSHFVSPAATSRIRWWPALVILGGALAALGALECMTHDSVQQKWMKQAMIGMVTSILLVMWFFLASRFSGKILARGLVLMSAAVGLFFLCFKLIGVSGDLMPQFAWRWAHHEAIAQPIAATDGLPTVPPGVVDFPQFLGPTRDARLLGPKLARDWRAHPPQLLWRQPIGEGWGGYATTGGIAVTQEQRQDKELVVAYHLASGKVLWSVSEDTHFDDKISGNGPRATPTIANGRVFTVGARGHLSVLDLATGARIWNKNIMAETGAKLPDWGFSASPLHYGDSVIVVAGQPNGSTLVAYHEKDGTRLWTGGTQVASYSSPIIAAVDGRDQLLYFGADKFIGLDPANGKLLWETPWCATNKYPNVAVPVRLGPDAFLISAGYGKGSAQFNLTHPQPALWQADETWKTLKMKAKCTNLVLHKNYIYGLDDGVFACQDPQDDGRLKWRDGKYGHGQCLLVGDLIVVTAETGELVLIDPSPEGLRELASIPVFNDKSWNPPTIAGEYLLMRNAQEAACFRLAVE